MKGRVKKKSPLVSSSVKSLRKAPAAFHELTAELQAAKSTGKSDKAASIQKELDNLGGRGAYQEASVLATSRSRHTSKWVFSELTRLAHRPGKGEPALRVLEVGAVNTQICSIPWMDVHAIDINSCNPRIKQIDFFDLVPNGEYFVVVCSMVINCVPTPEARGQMMRNLYAHTHRGGLVFLTLPLRCLTHSKATTWDMFVAIAEKVGFSIQSSKISPKVAFFCLRRPDGTSQSKDSHDCQPPPGAEPCPKSSKRNNSFDIVL
eukprot:CAMPEP_0177758208 /NCGR_PEP_ID=MMETSP0491_2-20121128/4062_1 /TAXON_ID=63592 /ORGANISM="Tetraselmis chuii, Strain PLY429" /LENGTH=261 /DNA_ID=CAMNT_0019273927 /DNA_START=106 /DNA_END=890 /DNA_ORIENTATION=+